MTRDDVIRLAQEADLWAEQELQCFGWEFHPDFHDVRDLRFAALVAAAAKAEEREACAVAALDAPLSCLRQDTREACADAIRARGQA